MSALYLEFYGNHIISKIKAAPVLPTPERQRTTPGVPDIVQSQHLNYIIFPVKIQVAGHFYAQKQVHYTRRMYYGDCDLSKKICVPR